MGDTFTVADSYIFTVLRWSPRVGIDLSKWLRAPDDRDQLLRLIATSRSD